MNIQSNRLLNWSCNVEVSKEENMKKKTLILLAGLVVAVSLTGCQKKEVKPGDVEGYAMTKARNIFLYGYTVLKILLKDRFTKNL